MVGVRLVTGVLLALVAVWIGTAIPAWLTGTRMVVAMGPATALVVLVVALGSWDGARFTRRRWTPYW